MNGVSKIVCVARNYSEQLTERTAPLSERMNSASIFLKPPSSIASIEPTINICGYTDVICETELAIQIKMPIPRRLADATDQQLVASIGGIGLAFDLTRKDLQTELKSLGKPWELAKAFDNACPLSAFCQVEDSEWFTNPIDISLTVNGKLQLNQPTSQMILNIPELLRTISRDISLWPGDIVLTGTPTKPFQPPRIQSGDRLRASLGEYITIESDVV